MKFKSHTSRIQLLTKKVIQSIRTYFRDLWSKFTGNKKHKQQQPQSMECSHPSRTEKLFGLKRTNGIRKTPRPRRNSHFKHVKTDDHVQQDSKTDSCHEKKRHRVSRFCKSVFSKH